MEKKDIKSLTFDELQNELSTLGEPRYRAAQVFGWLQKRGAASFDDMSDISKKLRLRLFEDYFIAGASIRLKRVSEVDGTIKYLYEFYDGEMAEAVVMKYHHGISICISTQIGCKMNCAFCATGKEGFRRNLLPSEMLSEIHTAELDISERISNIVLMGMGEPLDNFDNVMRFLQLVSDCEGLNIGMRHISLSTCGIVDRLYELAEKKLQLTLSVSLHAPNDEIRNRIMPVNGRWNVEELLKACRYYFSLTGRRISFEYAMMSGINDSDACARELAAKLRGMPAHVNLIPVNSIGSVSYKKSGAERLRSFSGILEKANITATVRRTLGSDIEASCGQLRGKFLG